MSLVLQDPNTENKVTLDWKLREYALSNIDAAENASKGILVFFYGRSATATDVLSVPRFFSLEHELSTDDAVITLLIPAGANLVFANKVYVVQPQREAELTGRFFTRLSDGRILYSTGFRWAVLDIANPAIIAEPVGECNGEDCEAVMHGLLNPHDAVEGLPHVASAPQVLPHGLFSSPEPSPRVTPIQTADPLGLIHTRMTDINTTLAGAAHTALDMTQTIRELTAAVAELAAAATRNGASATEELRHVRDAADAVENVVNEAEQSALGPRLDQIAQQLAAIYNLIREGGNATNANVDALTQMIRTLLQQNARNASVNLSLRDDVSASDADEEEEEEEEETARSTARSTQGTDEPSTQVSTQVPTQVPTARSTQGTDEPSTPVPTARSMALSTQSQPASPLPQPTTETVVAPVVAPPMMHGAKEEETMPSVETMQGWWSDLRLAHARIWGNSGSISRALFNETSPPPNKRQRGGSKSSPTKHDAFVFILHQISTFYGRLRLHPTIHYLRMIPKDIIINTVPLSGVPISDSAAATYIADTIKSTQQGQQRSWPPVDVPNETKQKLFADGFTDITRDGILVDQAHVFDFYSDFYNRVEWFAASTDSFPESNFIDETTDTNSPEFMLKKRLHVQHSADEILAFAIDIPGFLEQFTTANDGTQTTITPNFDQRVRMLRALAEQCVLLLPTYVAMIRFFNGQPRTTTAQLRSIAREQTQSILGTFLRLRVDGNIMNTRYQVRYNHLEIEQRAGTMRSPTGSNTQTMKVAEKKQTMLLQYNDDAEKYSVQKVDNTRGDVRTVRPLALTGTTPKHQSPQKRNRSSPERVTAATAAATTATTCDAKYKQSNRQNNGIYDRQFALGPFTEIFDPTMTNIDIADKMTDAVVGAMEDSRPVFLMGYGASGAGKTASLVYRNGGDLDERDGVAIHLCRKMGTRGWDKVTLVVHELYTAAGNVDETGLAGDKYLAPYSLVQPLTFDYDKDAGFGLETSTSLVQRHPYRFRTDAAALPVADAKYQVEKGTGIGSVLLSLLDKDRLVKKTPNNENSSRSHVLALLTFHKTEKDKSRSALLALGDFAGVENAFDCNNSATLAGMGDYEQSNNPLYVEELDNTQRAPSVTGGRLALRSLKEFSEREQVDFASTEGMPSNDPDIKLTKDGKDYSESKQGTSMAASDPVSKFIDGPYLDGKAYTIVGLEAHVIRLRLRYVPLMPPGDINVRDILSSVIKKVGLRLDPTGVTTLVKWLDTTSAAPDRIDQKNEQIRKISLLQKNALIHFRKMYLQYKATPAAKPTAVPTPGKLPPIFVPQMKVTWKKVQEVFASRITSSDTNGDPIWQMGKIPEPQNDMEATAYYKACLQYCDNWFDASRYASNFSDKSAITGDGSDPNAKPHESIINFWNVFQKLRWIRYNRFQYQIKAHMCRDRLAEGNYINQSLGLLRQSLQDAVNARCASMGVHLVPPIMPELAASYCPTFKGSCFSAAETIASGGKDADVPASDLMNLVFNAWNTNADTNKSSLSDFYEVLYPCVFCVANLTRGKDDPPPVPYIDVSALHTLVDNYSSVIIGGDRWHTEWNEVPQNMAVENAPVANALYANAPVANAPLVDIDQTAIRVRFLTECNDLLCRVTQRYAEMSLTLRDHPIFAKDAFPAALEKVRTNPDDANYEALYKIVAGVDTVTNRDGVLVAVDRSNASSTVGALEFLDRTAKYYRTNTLAAGKFDELVLDALFQKSTPHKVVESSVQPKTSETPGQGKTPGKNAGNAPASSSKRKTFRGGTTVKRPRL